TAILMSAACKGGAVLGNASHTEEKALEAFGLKFGYAFQITDDILDYTAEEKTFGKNLGKDLEEGKITLPLICLMNDAEESEINQVREILKSGEIAETDLAYVLHLFRQYKSIEKAYEKATIILDEARAELGSFGDSMEKKSLLTISDYLLNRKK
ncbi:MAG: polyprenyl synthetase family protein, partial [Nitrospirota bacterium]